MNRKQIIYANGFWATNIGNSFYGLGIIDLLKRLSNEFQFNIATDNCLYFRDSTTAKNDLNYLRFSRPDYLVLAGPLFTQRLPIIWHTGFDQLVKAGTKLIFLSAGLSKYTKEEINEVKRFLGNYKPFLLVSRDSETYQALHSLFEYSYDGICFGFTARKYYKPFKTTIDKKYIVVTIDNILKAPIKKWIPAPVVNILYKTKDRLRYKNKVDSILSNFAIDPMIINCSHAFCDKEQFIYRYSNSFVSDIPYDYLNLYANCLATISTRVHACVVTLAFGNPAMLLSKTNRSFLLDRVGLCDIRTKLVKIDTEYLDQEIQKQEAYIKEVMLNV